MRDKLAWIAVAASLASVSGSACAMSSADQPRTECRVIDGGKLPVESGGADALCEAVSQAIAKQAPGIGYDVEIRVLPMSRLSASITTERGEKLPDQNFARMDKPLTKGAFQRFASAIAAELAKADDGNS